MSRLLTSRETIILASASPRRRAYLEDLGLSFTVKVADIEEKISSGETPDMYVGRMSCAKAANVAENNPGEWIVAADTVVCFEGMVLGKPVDKEDAVAMLLKLSGQEHIVKTSICLFNKKRSVADTCLVSTRVLFWEYPKDMVMAYVQTEEPLDKAGSYGIQGKGGFLVREIHGSYSNVVGLPLCEFIQMLRHRRLISP
jgi:nucleoside triphosphate pyrophosphatase